MKIDENWSIEADSACWILSFEKEGEVNPKTGRPKMTRTQTYHATLASGLRWYLMESLKPSTDAQDVLARITEAEANIIKALEAKHG